jgi:hypothetical protein
MDRAPAAPLAGAIAMLVVAVACGGAAVTSVSPSPTPAPTPSPSPAATFAMGQMNGSGVSGTGYVIKDSGAFKVSITLRGLPPSSSHLSHIHTGRCATATNANAVAFALSETIADASGTATATSAIAAEYSVPMTGWYVNVHVGPDNTMPSYVPSVSCGDLPAA